MLKILVTPREIVCFPRQGLRWEAVGDQWSGMASHMSHKCYTVSSRLPRAASLTVLGEGSELKNWIPEQPEKANSIQAQASSFS